MTIRQYRGGVRTFSRRDANRRTGNAVVEPLERRRLLSGYTLHILSTFSQPEGSTGQIVEDQNGDLFFMHATGTPSAPSAVWELAKGSSTATQLVQFDPTVVGGVSGIDIDSAGDLFGTGTGSASNDGVIWEIAAGANTVTTFATFSRQLNGSNPTGNLVFDSSGDMFGRTLLGGADQQGIVWEIAHGSSTVTVLAPIPPSVNPGEGTVTVGGMAIDSNGNLYGTASPNGNAGYGSVWELPAGGSAITIVASFDGTDGGSPASGLFLDSSGDIFGEASSGGASFGNGNALSGQGYGSIFEITAGSSTITTLASFNGTDGEVPTGGLVSDANGNFFGVAMTGVATDSLLFELPEGGSATTTLQTFNDSTGIVAGTSPFVDANGDVIDATDIALFELSPGGGGGGGGGGTGLAPVINKSTVPAAVVGGAKLHGSLSVSLTNSSASASSGFTASVYASADTTLDATADTLVTTVTKPTTIKAGKSTNLTIPITELPASLDGAYYLIVQTTDSAGDMESVVSSSTTNVAPPFVALSETVTTTLPATLVSGTSAKGTVTLDITNNGNVPSKGSTGFDLTASTVSGTLGTTIAAFSKTLNILPGKSAKVVEQIKSVPALADGSYFIVEQTTDPFAAGTSIASLGSAITVAAPVITLTGVLGPASATGGDTLIVTNSGNIEDSSVLTGTVGFALDSSGTQAVGSTAALTTPVEHIAAGKSVKIHSIAWKSILSSLEKGVPYYLTVSFTDATGSSGFAVSSTSFMLS